MGHNQVDITMDGKPFQANKFVHNLRMRYTHTQLLGLTDLVAVCGNNILASKQMIFPFKTRC